MEEIKTLPINKTATILVYDEEKEAQITTSKANCQEIRTFLILLDGRSPFCFPEQDQLYFCKAFLSESISETVDVLKLGLI